MKKIILCFICIIFVFSAVCINFTQKLEHIAYQKKVIHTYPDINLLKNGDIILRRAYGMDSNIAVNFSDGEKRYSHAGIIIKDLNGIYVIHSIDDKKLGYHGLTKESLDNYLNGIKIWSIYRYTQNKNIQDKIASTSMELLKKNIMFDNQFDLMSEDKMYCSEFVYKTINRVTNMKMIIAKKIFLGRKFVTISNLYETKNATMIQNSHLMLEYINTIVFAMIRNTS